MFLYSVMEAFSSFLCSKAYNIMYRSVMLVLLLCVIAHASEGFNEGLLRNGDFEKGPKASQLRGTELIGHNAIPEWETSGFVEYIPSGHKQGDMLIVVPHGLYAVRLGNGASIKQRVRVDVGVTYSVTFSTARTCAQNEQVNVTAGTESAVLPIQTMYSSNGWDSYAWAWKSDVTEVDLTIGNPEDSEDPACGPVIDQISMKVIEMPKATNLNLLKNGNFEEGPYIGPNSKCGVLIPPHMEDENSPLPAWIVESLKAVKYINSPYFSIPKGKHAIELVGGMESAISQTVRTVPGKFYALSFFAGDANNVCIGSLGIQAFAGRETFKVAFESKGTGSSKHVVFEFKAISARTRVVFLSSFYTMRSDDMSSLCGPVLDDVVMVGIRGRN